MAAMKEFHFYIIMPAIAALECGLILSGFLTPLSSYSAGNIAFSLVSVLVMICMGWTLSGLGLKKVALKGALAALAAVVVLSLFSIIGYGLGRPVLGMAVRSAYYLPAVLLSVSITNILIFTLFAAIGALLAGKFRHQKKSPQKKSRK
jgi:hypothetical protein